MVTPLQKQIIETLNVKATIDPATELRARVDFLKNYLLSSGARGYVLGISGGQDSALAGKIAQIAISELRESTGDNSFKFLALLLPYGVQKDAEDALLSVDFIQADEVINFNIKDTVDAFENTFNRNARTVEGDVPSFLLDYHKGNVKARIRANVQYAYAGSLNRLVIGTDHAAEAVSGFFTIHGDGAADLLPLSGLNKAQGKEILHFLNAPEVLIKKAPTADLLDGKPQQADETELGVTYSELDTYLTGGTVEQDSAEKIEQRYLKTEFKRHLPITPQDTWYKESVAP